MTGQRSRFEIHTRCQSVAAERLRTDRKMARFEAHRSQFRSCRSALRRLLVAANFCDAAKNRSQSLTRTER